MRFWRHFPHCQLRKSFWRLPIQPVIKMSYHDDSFVSIYAQVPTRLSPILKYIHTPPRSSFPYIICQYISIQNIPFRWIGGRSPLWTPFGHEVWPRGLPHRRRRLLGALQGRCRHGTGHAVILTRSCGWEETLNVFEWPGYREGQYHIFLRLQYIMDTKR